jgi:hypothetical protein
VSNAIGPDPDPQNLLPAGLRAGWAVVPRSSLYGLFVAGAVLGAGAALSAVGFALGHDPLRWGFPVALALAGLGRVAWDRAERRRLNDLRGRSGTGR